MQKVKTYNIEIAPTVRVNVNEMPDGRILYQLESALFGKWVPCGNCTEYTNVPEKTLSDDDMQLLKQCDGVHATLEEIVTCKSCEVLLKD